MRGFRCLLPWGVAVAALASPLSAEEAAWTRLTVRYVTHADGSRAVVNEASEASASAVRVQEVSYPQFVVEHAALGNDVVHEITGTDASAVEALLAQRGLRRDPAVLRKGAQAGDELVTLVDNGPAANRIDLVFMGDGYTAAERQKFFDDVRRLVDDMFVGDTFASYLPLFNVHAVFRPSRTSGIGRGRAADTAYGLYREGNTLRAIMPGDMAAIRASCRVAPGCDYPIVIANDPYYGGLGGEVAISTSSPASGPIVLRHELGHNFGRVGEEYDGGGYFGANQSPSLGALKWKHWASEASVRAEPAVARFVAWPWHALSQGPYTARFTSEGRHARAVIRMSASGIETPDTLSVTLDGQALPYESPNTADRSFQDLALDQGFSAGSHALTFHENVADGNNWVSSLTVHEYGADFHDEPGFIGAFPLYQADGRLDGYRATDEACLMRNMQSSRFCPVCQENNWLNFFAKVKLIDDVARSVEGGDAVVALRTIPLDAARGKGGSVGRVTVRWFKDGTERADLRDRDSFRLPQAEAKGQWRVEARFETPEVRKDPSGLLSDKKSFAL